MALARLCRLIPAFQTSGTQFRLIRVSMGFKRLRPNRIQRNILAFPIRVAVVDVSSFFHVFEQHPMRVVKESKWTCLTPLSLSLSLSRYVKPPFLPPSRHLLLFLKISVSLSQTPSVCFAVYHVTSLTAYLAKVVRAKERGAIFEERRD